ncbi:MAG: D-alanyl-D-alanine carboxypeptidase family protein [Patescibacteria group bacterium]|nr:D-alanyl-D-alanine carboxypeptidase family protein [Patescibacteria group bacterium]
MNTLATILIVVFLPFNYYFAGFLNAPRNAPAEESRIQENRDAKKSENAAADKSFKGSLSEDKAQKEGFGGSGYVPQRKKNYYDTKIFASSSVVIDVDSGTILHYDEGRLRMPIASLTKMMTAVVVMEKMKNLDEVVTIDEEATLVDGTKVGCPRSGYCVDERLRKGEKVTVKDLLMAMLLNSANDAAVALGNHIAGSQKEFAELMNKKAEELNLGDSKFCNPSGLDEDNCFSSAYDLARITAYSMRYDLIWKIMKTPEVEIGSCDGKFSHRLKNTDVLLGQIPNCLGGKTGFTYNAGKSLMLAVADPATGKHKVISVILNDNNRWEDMTKLINWTFENYEWK